MRLYYMTSLETAVTHILPERRMRIAQFQGLNDPFELMSVRLDGQEGRKIFKALLDHWNKTLGVICMAKDWKSPLMWTHYAKNHTGVCLGFEVPDDKPIQMKYEAERIKLILDLQKPIGGIDRELLLKVLTTKFTQWAYEQEWRLLSKLEERDPDNGFFYIPFGPALSLREIIVGTRCKKPIGSFKKLLTHIEEPVTIIKARAAFESFSMVKQKRIPTITVRPKR